MYRIRHLWASKYWLERREGMGGIRYSVQNSLRERNFAYIKNPIQLVSFLFFLSIYSETPQRIVVWIERSQRLRQKILRYSYRSSGQGKPTSIIKNPMSFFTFCYCSSVEYWCCCHRKRFLFCPPANIPSNYYLPRNCDHLFISWLNTGRKGQYRGENSR